MKKLIKHIIVSYLMFCARTLYIRNHPLVIGVTGSSGKTTVKYFISKLIECSDKKVQYTLENLNTETGLPLAVLGIKKPPKNVLEWLSLFIKAPFIAFLAKMPKYLVLEYASDKPGDMKFLTDYFEPDIAVITSIGVAHIETFKSKEAIAKEKWTLAQASKEYVVIGKKDLEKVKNNKINASLIVVEDKKEIVDIYDISKNTNGADMTIKYYTQEKKVKFPYIGDHNIFNLKLALLALHYSVGGDDSIIEDIAKLTPLEGRGERFIGKKELMIIDESYNANPESMFASLKNLESINYGRKVVVLGEMKELGKITQKSHKEIAKISKKIADLTIGVGQGFRECELDYWYPDVGRLAKEIDEVLDRGDVVLIKGSHSNNLKIIVEMLK